VKRGTEEIFEQYSARYEFVRQNGPTLRQAAQALEDAYRQGGKLLVCGNGGSCADADHIVGELVKSFRIRRPLNETDRAALCQAGGDASLLAEKLEGSFPAINLCAHSALVSALSNDIGADYVYAQQVMGYGRPGDVFLGISTSGRSKNVLYAGEAARALGLKSIALTGPDGGLMGKYFDLIIRADAGSTEDVQDLHSAAYHLLCAMVENQLWGA